jgi:hypothetical protein
MRPRDLLQYLEDAEARRKGLRIWIFLVLAWSIGRSIIVAKVFAEYGLIPQLYFAIDFLSSIPYAYASAQSLLTYIDKKKFQSMAWALVTAVAFYLPDIYIVIASHHVPPSTYFGFALVLAVLSALAYVQWKEKRR